MKGRDGLEHDQAVEAIRAIGTNALPAIEERLYFRDSTPRLLWLGLLQRLGFRVAFASSTQSMKDQGLAALECLGSTAAPLLPVVAPRLTNWIEADLAARALRSIGTEDAMRRLSCEATNIVVPVRWAVAGALDYRAPTNLTHAAFVSLLHDSDVDTRQKAVWSLGRVQEHKSAAVGLLLTALDDPDNVVRVSAVSSIGRLATQETNVVQVLKRLATDSDETVANSAAAALRRIQRDPKFDPIMHEAR